MDKDAAHQRIMQALADYFEIEPESIGGHILGVEFQTEDGVLHFETIWRGTQWNIKGYQAEIRDQIREEMARRAMASIVAASEES